MMYFLAILLPPLAVLLTGRPFLAILNLVLTCCFWIPGAVHAIFVVHNKKSDEHNKALIDAIKQGQSK